jgi:DNA-directed RNA polymerase subunit RPC12/RpoP
MPRLKKQYLVVPCANCKRLLLASSDKKTRTCPYCGERMKIGDAQIIFQSQNPSEAREALQDAKTRLRS